MKHLNKWLATLAIAGVSTLAGAAYAQGEKPGEELIVYTGTGIPTDFADALVEPFSKLMQEKYGVPVHVRTVPGTIPTVWAQLQAEWPNPRR